MFLAPFCMSSGSREKRGVSARIALFALVAFIFALPFFAASTAQAEDGYRLWLRYDALPEKNVKTYQLQITGLMIPGKSDTLSAIQTELTSGCLGLLGKTIPVVADADKDGVLVVGTPETSPAVAALKKELEAVGKEGYLIRSTKVNSHSATVIAANSEVGALYGAFHFLRLVQTLQPIDKLNVTEKPRMMLRVLDHWDNLDGSIERGYAGKTLWDWKALPDKVDARLTDYARANASLGINGAVLNNVNANAKSLSPEYLQKTAAIAKAFRPYGIRVYLTPRFSCPMDLGGLKTADPLDPEVAAWWKTKADEIYTLIPDFGGFLVKANSEGQPGPVTYQRSHADGANTLAAALAPHNGVVMWRAFVYDAKPGSDRITQAYDTLKPFDGKFASNVLLQVKNGPLDFMPREPFHPLFGGMTQTPVMAELQITQEYLGQSQQLAYLGTMWKEFLDSDTYKKGKGSTVAKVLDGSLYGTKLTGIAGVANTGTDRNWTGHDLAQSNWYAFGRLAWNPDNTAQQIAEEWTQMTLTHDKKAAETITKLLMDSREAVVNYSMPLGLVHIMAGPHYGPMPWGDKGSRIDWTPVYYHHAAADAIGFDRTAKGSNSVGQYAPEVGEKFGDLATCPENLLVWFHRIPWDHKMKSGKTFWEELCQHYQTGVNWTKEARKQWDSVAGAIDKERYAAIAAKFAIQETDATAWHDACIAYFQSVCNLPLPKGIEKPQKTLEEYIRIYGR